MDAKTHFKKSMEQHEVMSKAHGVLAEQCEQDGDSAKAEAHRTLEKTHADRAKHYGQMHSDAANKAVADELNKNRNELPPPAISRVTPTPPGITAVPRAGMKPVEKVEVDPEFQESLGLGKFMHVDEPSLQ